MSAASFTSERDAILAHAHGPLRIVAGAGAGKTRVLVDRVTRLIADGHATPREILALTFTNKAAEEMADRVRRALRDHETVGARHDLDELTMTTFHAFCAGLLREYGTRIGIERDAQVIGRAKTWQMMLAVLDEVSFDDIQLNPSRLGTDFVDLVVQLAGGLADHLRTADDLERHARAMLAAGGSERHEQTLRRQLEIIPVLRAYEERKRSHNLLDYGDQVALAVRLLTEHADVRAAVREQYRFVFVDEYQDTNVAQRRLLQSLAIEAGVVGNLTVVGDNDQSIYAFRGATVENILHFERDFPGAATLPLSVNHRSGPEILAVAEAIIGKVPPERRARKTLRPADDAEPARVETFVATDEVEEARCIAELIEQAKPWAEALDGRLEPFRGWRAFGVLAAVNADLAPIASALQERGIPYELVGAAGFYERPEILDLLAVLRAVADPSDNLAVARMLFGARYRIGARDLLWVARAAVGAGKERAKALGMAWKEDHLYRLIDGIERCDSVAELSSDARERLTRFRIELRDLIRASNRLPLTDFVSHVVDHTGVLTECAASPSADARLAERNIARLRDLAHVFEPLDGRSDLTAFLEYLDFAEEAEEAEGEAVPSDDDTVKLATIHRAKGLEFPCVFLAAMEGDWPWKTNPKDETKGWNVIPHALRGDREYLPEHQGDDDAFREKLKVYEAEEHRRIGYVGCTRAMRRLVLSRAHFYRKNKKPLKPADFWEEILATNIPVALFPDAEVPASDPLSAPTEPVETVAPVPEHDWRPRYRGPTSPTPDIDASDLIRELDALVALEASRAPRTAPGPVVPREISVSALLDYRRCPRLFYQRHVLGLPEAVSWAARRGTEIHRWIEERSWAGPGGALPDVPGAGPESLLPEDIVIDADGSPDEGDERGDASDLERLKATFLASRFAGIAPRYAELPFALRVGEITIRGRIDAVYDADGGLEVVDYKSGVHPGDPRQLQVYARAVREILGVPVARLTFLNVRDGTETSVEPDDGAWIDDLAAAVAREEIACSGACDVAEHRAASVTPAG